MLKKILIIMMIAAIAMFSFACGEKADSKAEDTQAADTNTAEDESTGLEWPSQYMSTLPAPDSKISRVEKLNGTEEIAEGDTTTQPSSVNVVMNEMTKDEAIAYYEKLKSSGFEINTDEKSKDKILLVGTLNDADQNPFLFSYIAGEEFGNISITILKGVYGGETPDNMKPDDSGSAVSDDSTPQ